MDTNFLAIVVLIFLIINILSSLILILQTAPIPKAQSWFHYLIPLFALPGLPGVLDLIQTKGLTGILAMVVFFVLLASASLPLVAIISRKWLPLYKKWLNWTNPTLVFAGLLVAGYLAYIEFTETNPVCGIGLPGCVTVQSSQYARLFDVIPIGLLGLIGYLCIFFAWILGRKGSSRIKKISALSVWGMSFFGVIFSTYLTFLEPFVIHASCSWCITLAVLMMLLLWVSTPDAQYSLLED